jgi:hypothetical protein
MIPDSIIKIQTSDNSLFVFKSNEIDHIGSEQQATNDSTGTKGKSAKKIKQRNPGTHLFSLYGGFGFAAGDFSDAGGAATGFTIGFQIAPKAAEGIVFDGSYTSNGLSNGNSGRWTSIFLLGGYKVTFNEEDPVQISIAPLLGVSFSSTPPVLIVTMSGYNYSDGKSALAIAYGIQTRVQFTPHFYTALRFVACKPEYKFDIVSYSQSTQIINLLLGVNL